MQILLTARIMKYTRFDNPEPVICKVCGQKFLPRNSSQTICSDKCVQTRIATQSPPKEQKPKPTGVCKICGNTFVKTVPNRVYCSECCSRKAEKARDQLRYAESRHKKEERRECLICGKEFVVRGPNARYCSKSCKYKGARAHIEIAFASSSIRKCHDCGKPTTNYRCAECLTKWKIKNGLSIRAEAYEAE